MTLICDETTVEFLYVFLWENFMNVLFCEILKCLIILGFWKVVRFEHQNYFNSLLNVKSSVKLEIFKLFEKNVFKSWRRIFLVDNTCYLTFWICLRCYWRIIVKFFLNLQAQYFLKMIFQEILIRKFYWNLKLLHCQIYDSFLSKSAGNKLFKKLSFEKYE